MKNCKENSFIKISGEKNIEPSYKPQVASDKQKRLSDESNASQPQTTNDKPETTNMDGHKHPHHVTTKRNGKKTLRLAAAKRTMKNWKGNNS